MIETERNSEKNEIILDGAQYRREPEGILLERAADTEEIRIPDEIEGEPVRWAAPYAFARTRAREVRLPIDMEKIGNYSFYRCFGLRMLSFSDTLVDVGSGTFNGCALREIRIDHYRGEKSSLKFLADELRYALYVTLRYHREDGRVDEARLLFPEHYEEAVENTPARIVETHYHGSGGDYRQCFYNRELQFAEYDRLFPRAVAEESQEDALQLAALRLCWPYKLAKEAADRYGAYLREHMSCAGKVYVERQDMHMLRFFGQAGYWDQEGLDAAVDAAAGNKETEILGFLMDERRRLFPKKKKVFEL